MRTINITLSHKIEHATREYRDYTDYTLHNHIHTGVNIVLIWSSSECVYICIHICT